MFFCRRGLGVRGGFVVPAVPRVVFVWIVLVGGVCLMGARRLVFRTVFVCCVAMVGLLAAVVGSASGAFTHNYVSAFERAGGEPFSNVEGVAVDRASGDVYVYDAGFGEGAGAILKFDGSGAPVGFSGIAGEPNVIEGVGGAGEGEGELAVDESGGPAKGDIYVAGGGVVRVYGADGSSLGSLTPPSGWGSACGVAVDTSGDVYGVHGVWACESVCAVGQPGWEWRLHGWFVGCWQCLPVGC